MRIYSDETLKRRRLFSLPGLTTAFLLVATMCCVLLVGAIIGLRVADSPSLYGFNRWLLDTYIAKRIVTPALLRDPPKGLRVRGVTGGVPVDRRAMLPPLPKLVRIPLESALRPSMCRSLGRRSVWRK